ncbi:hypothetical protein E8L99_17005 [Phreatobacter aquaticus]|uniref:Uncharacterized protein n=1 Tax=Phreatobacter aquaticus TaxID=2570229 RepID=A0A4D7QJR2_9HYPH|nr:hypothetical protein [Phreatobacter aquaticus]QCK87335.1 hypothetical protein E8L99_17005 [Phreatobacter aquaticus]
MRTTSIFLIAAATIGLATAASAQSYDSWPVLQNPFPSTGGGGFMIDGYDPVVADGRCRTNFSAIDPNGTVYRNRVVFDAVPTEGGILCTNGRWQALDGSAAGTTPFQVFIKDGVVRRLP